MDVSPDALYTCLRRDLLAYCSSDLLDLYRNRSDFPVGCDPKAAAAISISRSLLKKFETRNTEKLDSVALLKFLEFNDRCSKWVLKLDSSWDEVLWGELKRAVLRFCTFEGGDTIDLHPYTILSKGGVGPGVCIGGRGNDFYTKLFSSPLAYVNPSLYLLYKRYIRSFPEWAAGESLRDLEFGTEVVEGSRLSFVPKNDKTSRCICIEPGLGMFYQLGIKQILEHRLKTWAGVDVIGGRVNTLSIDLANQQFKNRELARRGSLFDDLITIDLESASDSVSYGLVAELFPRSVKAALEMCRSPAVLVPGLGYTPLGMWSSMGNGYTFPLQTCIFTCIVVAAARARGFPLRFPRGDDHGSFGVNGDDIVIPREIARDVFRLLHLAGFVVNRDKTFVEGPFRESCGADFFFGKNIRGVYVKRLDTEQDRYSVINQLNLFSTRTGLALSHTVRYLISSVRWLPVPRASDASSGIRLPLSLITSRLDRNGSFVYWYWEPRGKKIRISESAVFVPKGAKPRTYNPSGLFVSFLQGGITNSSIGVRHDTVGYIRRRGVTPCWDHPEATHPLAGWFPDDVRWKTAVYLNL